MIGVLLALLAPMLLVAVVRTSGPDARRAAPALLIGYLARMVIQFFGRDLPFFSHGGGGDCQVYEQNAELVTRVWDASGVRFITGSEMGELGPTSLPPNLFALVYYLNGEPTRVGCVAVIALLSCLTCLNVYLLAVEFGSAPKYAHRIMLSLLFSPSALLYTSDMYKDGLVLFCVIGALGCSLRLSRKFTVLVAAEGILCILALWFIRFYLIFLTLIPLFVGIIGVRSKGYVRPLLAAGGSVLLGIALVSFTNLIETTSGTMSDTFEGATRESTRQEGAEQGSGVVFDDGGSPFGQLWLKLLYTLFAPFPWQGGSIGLQIGKIEVMLWYYIAYRAYVASRRLWVEDRTQLLMFLTFILPTSLMYATAMSNVGLIMRERMPIIAVTALLSSLSWQDKQKPLPATAPMIRALSAA